MAPNGRLPALVPDVGDYSVLCDGEGRPAAIIETTDVRVGPLSSVDDQFAWDEGEGDRTRADWLRMHTAAFRRHHDRIGREMHPDIPVVFERFAVAYPVLNDVVQSGEATGDKRG